ncbi:MAG: RidA family protein [Hyphomicrobiales bacterium]|nr:RidA family protein [Hyphomicrobiales bacterium]
MPAHHQLRRGLAAHRVRQGPALRFARTREGRGGERNWKVSSPENPIVAPAIIPEAEAEPRSLNPRGWPRPKGYANGMTARGRAVLTGGVVGWDAMGQFPEGFVAQARRCFHNIRAILAEGGAEPRHLVRLTWYVTDIDAYLAEPKELGEAYRSAFGRNYPAMAVVEVKRLVEKAALLEIEATAIVPD